MSDFITEIRERRVLPAVGVYAAGCWVLVEILDRLVERYLLSPFLTDIVFWGLYSLIPAVILVSWSYGRPGKDKATTAQKVGVPINIIATAGLLLTLFGGKDLGATANRVTISNEEGVVETHIVPRDAFRRRFAVFFYTNKSDDLEIDWLQYGATELLTQDLQQDPFVFATSPYAGWANGYYARMKSAGFEDGLKVPRTLMREIAQDANRQYFIEGDIDRAGDDFILTTRVWDSANMNQVAEIRHEGWDIYGLMDATSREVREAAGVPSPGTREDLPLAETYGESGAALRAYIEGLNTRLFTNDINAANAQLDQALEEDQNFVLGYFIKAINLLELGDLPGATEQLEQAQRLDYRLPSTDRATLKALYYRASGQSDKLMEFVRLQVRLRDDAQSHAQLGQLLMVAGEREEAKQELKIALERDSLNAQLNLTLSILERSTGDMEAAIEYARRYQIARPEDMEANLQLGNLLRDSGELDQADEHYRQAQLIESDSPTPILSQVNIAARRGDEGQARRLLEEASLLARTPTEKALVHLSAASFEGRLGRIEAAIDQILAAETLLKQSQPPFSVVLATYPSLVRLHLQQGDLPAADQAYATSLQAIQPPLNQFLASSGAEIKIQKQDFAGAEQDIAAFRKVIEEMNFEAVAFQADILEAGLRAEQGNHGRAIELLQSSLEQVEDSFAAAQMHEQLVPTLYSFLAEFQLKAGDMEGARAALETGLRLDPSLPALWVVKAQLQKAKGEHALAEASLNYALAIWASADPNYLFLLEAKDLAREFAGVTD
jgi:tetratricopeptide (TPR) repeat protein/TolB-like protein